MLHIAGVNYESIADAPGVCCTIFISGCRHHCKGCQSPATHNFSYGASVTKELIEKINEEIKMRPYLNGIVLSGGDPMYSAKEVNELLNHLIIPKNRIWCFTGFLFEELLKNKEQKKLLERIDVLIDGQFILSQRDVTLRFRGSHNQRLIDVQKSFIEGKTVLWDAQTLKSH